MKSISLSEGLGRTRVHLTTRPVGDDLVVFLFNEQGHVGAVALADYSFDENRASASVITRLGHKDDAVAHSAAQRLCKLLKRPVCAIAGIHVDKISEEEIAQITRNCERLVDRLAATISGQSSAISDTLLTADDR
jgi:gallate decarboxylase subunit D